MLPYINIGTSIHIPTFGLFLWLGGVAAVWILHRNFVRNGIKHDAITVVALAMVLGVVGAKLWHELQAPDLMVREIKQACIPGWHHPLDTIINLLQWFSSGFAWFGGLVAGVLTLMWQGAMNFEGQKVGAIRMLDLATPAAALGYGVGRIGCLTSGDGDYGIATHLPWGVHMKSGPQYIGALDPPNPNPPDLLVHPTPVYECLFGIALAAYLWMRGRKKIPVGQLTGEYLVISGIGRYLVEIIRRNPKLYFGHTTTNAQVAALASVLVGFLIILAARISNRRPAEATAA